MKNKIFISLLPFETKRLIIRKTTVNDVNMLLKMDKQEKTQKYLGGIKNKTREERIAFIEKKLEKFDKGLAGQLTVCLKDGTSIGLIGLNIREENNTGEISYIFDYDYCNKGYCTEACQKLLEIGFNSLNLKSISADTVDGNASSKRVLEKLGFVYEDSFIKDSTVFLLYTINKNENDLK
jgi:ribosomal-protein-alanine N-acetyltransferase